MGEIGYGSAKTQTLPLQTNFEPYIPEAMLLHSVPGHHGEKPKTMFAERMQKGLVLYGMYLKQPPPPKSADDGSGWLDWFPKVGVFGVVLVGVVIWNVRKETSGMDFGGGGMDDAKMEELVKDAMRQAGASE